MHFYMHFLKIEFHTLIHAFKTKFKIKNIHIYIQNKSKSKISCIHTCIKNKNKSKIRF